MKPFYIALLATVMFTGICRAQHLQDSLISIPPGTYTPTEILKIIDKKGIAISYSQSALRPNKVKITNSVVKVAEVLKQAFDLRKFDILERDNKILIVPRKDRGLKGLLGYVKEQGLISQTPTNPTTKTH